MHLNTFTILQKLLPLLHIIRLVLIPNKK